MKEEVKNLRKKEGRMDGEGNIANGNVAHYLVAGLTMCTRDHPQQYLSFLADRERKTEKEGRKRRGTRIRRESSLQEERNERFSLLSLFLSVRCRVCTLVLGVQLERATVKAERERERERNAGRKEEREKKGGAQATHRGAR